MKCLVEEEPNTCAFEEKTTYLNDYRWCTPSKRQYYKWPKSRCPSPSRGPLKGDFRPKNKYLDSQTLTHWKDGAHVPFYLYWEPKQSVNTDPTKIIEVPSKQKKEFEDREEQEKQNSIKTRPRLYVSPAVSVDDIEDPIIRQTLIDFTYITDWEKNCREACLPSNPVKIVPDVSCYRDPQLDVVVKTVPFIPTNLRSKTKIWDSQQTRACIDPSEVFWRCQEPQPPTKDLVKALVPEETRQEIRQLIEEEKLRKEHDRLPPTYAGHRPIMNPGLPLRANDFPVEHPLVSNSQAYGIRYRNIKRCL